MSSLTGIYGSRKGLSSELPFLTAKATIPIGQLFSEDLFTEEGVLLAGILFCGLWSEGKEQYIDQRVYDILFASSENDPIGCVRMYLEQHDIDPDRMGELIEASFENGYLQDSPPFYGGVGIFGLNDENLSNWSSSEPPSFLNYKPYMDYDVDDVGFKQYEFLINSGMFDSSDRVFRSWNEILMNVVKQYLCAFELDYSGNDIPYFIAIINQLDQKYLDFIESGVIRDYLESEGDIIAFIKISDFGI